IYTNTGPLAQLGIDMRDGALLFWSQAGQRAGGRRVEILTESTGSNKPDEGLTKARKLVERDRAHILGGIIETPVAYALRPYVIEKKTPLMIMNAVAVAIFGSDAMRFVAQYAEVGLKGKIPLIGKGGLTDESFLDKLGDPALGIIVAYHWTAALDLPANRRVREAFESRHRRPMNAPAEQGYVGSQMIARALDAVRGDIENLDGFLAAM